MGHEYLSELFPRLGEEYRLKMMLNEFWEMNDKIEAQSFLAFWCDLAGDSEIFPFKNAVKTIQAHWKGIVNYIDSNINNGILGGVNAKIQLAKKAQVDKTLIVPKFTEVGVNQFFQSCSDNIDFDYLEKKMMII